jgi:phage gp37-like protein
MMESLREAKGDRRKFADGYLVFSDHLYDRLRDHSINQDSVEQLLRKLEVRRSIDLIQMPYINFVVKTPDLALAFSKQLDNNGDTAFVINTVHRDLRMGQEEDVIYLEDQMPQPSQGVAEGKLVESAVFLNPTTVVVGQAHGQPLELSPDTLKKIQAIAAKHGAWYEGNGTDRSYTKGQIDRYVGSWDDEVAKTASPNDPKWLYVLFANVDENNRVQRVGVDPKDTIFNRLLTTAQDNSFQGIGYTSQALQNFLQMASEGKYDFLKMSQQPATQQNLTRFLKAGEALMWPSNWEQYPNRAGKIAKAATVDVRDQYLATRKAGVYVTGSGHLKAVQNITGQQGVAENFADGRNPGRKGLAKRSGVNTKASVSSLRKTAKNSSGEKQRMAHWLANMKAGRAKAKRK